MFTLTCRCGQRIEGERTTTFRDVVCPGCRRMAQVFPLSPLARALRATSDVSDRPTIVRWWRRRQGQWMLMGLVGVLLLVVGIVMMSWPSSPEVVVDAPKVSPEQASRMILSYGDHLQAAKMFHDAARTTDDPIQKRRLTQWARQTGLIADLLPVGLPEILRRVPGTPDDVWQQTFDHRYANMALVFDMRIYRDATGRYRHDFEQLTHDDEEIRIAWEELELLAGLPLDESERVIFGARVRTASRSPVGWVVHPHPDSGVLFTDAEVFAGTSLPVVDDEMREVFKRQTRWLDEHKDMN